MDQGPQPDTEPQRCRAITRRRERCPRRVLPGKHLCLPHGRGAGAPKRNRNARKHGFYAQESYQKRREERDAAQRVPFIDDQVPYLRAAILGVVCRDADLVTVARGVEILLRSLRTQRALARTSPTTPPPPQAAPAQPRESLKPDCSHLFRKHAQTAACNQDPGNPPTSCRPRRLPPTSCAHCSHLFRKNPKTAARSPDLKIPPSRTGIAASRQPHASIVPVCSEKAQKPLPAARTPKFHQRRTGIAASRQPHASIVPICSKETQEPLPAARTRNYPNFLPPSPPHADRMRQLFPFVPKNLRTAAGSQGL